MSIIRAGTTTTTALTSIGNTDGTLQFQINGTTTSLTLNTLGAVGVGSTPNFGTSGQVLTSAGSTAAPTWTTISGGSPAGSNTQIQFNNSGAFGASSALTFDGSVVRNVQSSGTNAWFRATSGTVDTYFGAATSGLGTVGVAGTFSNNDLVFYSNNSERARIDTSGTFNVPNTTGSNIPAIRVTQNDATANRYLRGIQIDQTTNGAGTNVSSGAIRISYNGSVGFDNVVEDVVITPQGAAGTSQNGYGGRRITTFPLNGTTTSFNNNYYQNYSLLNVNGYLSNTNATAFKTGYYGSYIATICPASTNQDVFGLFISNSGSMTDGYVFGIYQQGASRNYFDGKMYMPAVYNNTVGGTNRDVFVDNTGLVGYVSSTRASKKNIASITDASWLMQLNPVTFNRRVKKDGVYTEETYVELEYGLIAEEVETVNSELCFYDDVKVEQPEGYEGEDQFTKELRGVHYSKLVVPLLKLVQEQQAMIEQLKADVAALKGQP